MGSSRTGRRCAGPVHADAGTPPADHGRSRSLEDTERSSVTTGWSDVTSTGSDARPSPAAVSANRMSAFGPIRTPSHSAGALSAPRSTVAGSGPGL